MVRDGLILIFTAPMQENQLSYIRIRLCTGKVAPSCIVKLPIDILFSDVCNEQTVLFLMEIFEGSSGNCLLFDH